jgi:hypothetical protein
VFLTHLAVAGKVAASTQNQAKSALLFLYKEVLEAELPWLDDVARAKAPKRLIALLHLLLKFVPRAASEWVKARAPILCPCCGAAMKIVRTRIPPPHAGGPTMTPVEGGASDRVGETPSGEQRDFGAHEPRNALAVNRWPTRGNPALSTSFGRALLQRQARYGRFGTRRRRSGLPPGQFQKDICYRAPIPARSGRARPTIGSDRGKHDLTLFVRPRIESVSQNNAIVGAALDLRSAATKLLLLLLWPLDVGDGKRADCRRGDDAPEPGLAVQTGIDSANDPANSNGSGKMVWTPPTP